MCTTGASDTVSDTQWQGVCVGGMVPVHAAQCRSRANGCSSANAFEAATFVEVGTDLVCGEHSFWWKVCCWSVHCCSRCCCQRACIGSTGETSAAALQARRQDCSCVEPSHLVALCVLMSKATPFIRALLLCAEIRSCSWRRACFGVSTGQDAQRRVVGSVSILIREEPASLAVLLLL